MEELMEVFTNMRLNEKPSMPRDMSADDLTPIWKPQEAFTEDPPPAWKPFVKAVPDEAAIKESSSPPHRPPHLSLNTSVNHSSPVYALHPSDLPQNSSLREPNVQPKSACHSQLWVSNIPPTAPNGAPWVSIPCTYPIDLIRDFEFQPAFTHYGGWQNTAYPISYNAAPGPPYSTSVGCPAPPPCSSCSSSTTITNPLSFGSPPITGALESPSSYISSPIGSLNNFTSHAYPAPVPGVSPTLSLPTPTNSRMIAGNYSWDEFGFGRVAKRMDPALAPIMLKRFTQKYPLTGTKCQTAESIDSTETNSPMNTPVTSAPVSPGAPTAVKRVADIIHPALIQQRLEELLLKKKEKKIATMILAKMNRSESI